MTNVYKLYCDYVLCIRPKIKYLFCSVLLTVIIADQLLNNSLLVRGGRAIKGLFGSDSSKSTKYCTTVDNAIWFTFLSGAKTGARWGRHFVKIQHPVGCNYQVLNVNTRLNHLRGLHGRGIQIGCSFNDLR